MLHLQQRRTSSSSESDDDGKKKDKVKDKAVLDLQAQLHALKEENEQLHKKVDTVAVY